LNIDYSNRQQFSHRKCVSTVHQTGSTSPIGSQYPPSIKPAAPLPSGVNTHRLSNRQHFSHRESIPTVYQTVSTSPFRRGPSSIYLTPPHQEECAIDNLHKPVVKDKPAINIQSLTHKCPTIANERHNEEQPGTDKRKENGNETTIG
jgi:hypothetical protein